jgi:kinesin family protein 2/24
MDRGSSNTLLCSTIQIRVHSAKFQVDGITKYLDHSSFRFDHAFDETVSTEDVYRHSTMPLLDFVCNGTGGRATVFAYGQTGSGKTYTMNGIQQILCQDLFLILEQGAGVGDVCSSHDTVVKISFFEIYAGHIQDLLNNRHKCTMLEDGYGEIVIKGLEEFEASDPARFLDLVEIGNRSVFILSHVCCSC